MSLFAELRRRNVIRVAAAYSVVAWLVAQITELALDSFGTPDWIIKTILFLLAAGLPFAIIFAWAYELTPEGIKREEDVDRSESITHQTGRKLNYAIIGVLAVALVLAIGTRGVQFGSEEPVAQTVPAADVDDEKSIAVLPFVNMSDDSDNEYFSDGISEELLNVLVKVEGLRVASRTSSFSFKGKDTPIPDIAEALNVEHVLEGSVRKAGDTVRITAQLIDVKTDSHLWSETYDRKLEDIFVIQDEISAHIVDALKIALGTGAVIGKSSTATDNLNAYEDYLKGRYLWQRRGEDNIRRAIALFELATREDPLFSRAWSSLAAAHITLPTYAQVDYEFHFPLAQTHARRALELDPKNAEAYAVLGDVSRFLDPTEHTKTASNYIKAIELEPKSPTGYIWYAEFLAAAGRADRAKGYIDIALQLDPYHPGTMSVASIIYESLGAKEEAMGFLLSAWELGHPQAIYDLVTVQIVAGEVESAMQLVKANLDAEDLAQFQLFVDAFTDESARNAYFQDVLANTTPGDRMFLLSDYVQFGMLDEAFELLETEPILGNWWFFVWEPRTGPLREDSRFIPFITEAGLVNYWDEDGWSPFCSRNGEQITCR